MKQTIKTEFEFTSKVTPITGGYKIMVGDYEGYCEKQRQIPQRFKELATKVAIDAAEPE